MSNLVQELTHRRISVDKTSLLLFITAKMTFATRHRTASLSITASYRQESRFSNPEPNSNSNSLPSWNQIFTVNIEGVSWSFTLQKVVRFAWKIEKNKDHRKPKSAEIHHLLSEFIAYYLCYRGGIAVDNWSTLISKSGIQGPNRQLASI